MKRSLVAAAVGLALTAGTAHAGGILDSFGLRNPNTQGAGVYTTIDTMDWASSGSGLPEGITIGNPIAVGTNFTFDYQAFLNGVTLGGQSVAFPGLNTPVVPGGPSFEYTIVARFNETVIDGAVAINDQALFSTTGGSFGIYVDTTPDAVVATGAGFDNGTLVASGTIDPGQISSFTSTSATTGIGSSIIQGIYSFIDPAYMSLLGTSGLAIFDIRFEGTQNLPAGDSATTGFFIGGDPILFPDVVVATVGGTVLKVDGSSKNSVIPEPSTYLLVGMGLLGLVGYSRKRSKG